MPLSITCECGQELKFVDESASCIPCPSCGRQLVVIPEQPYTSNKAIASAILGMGSFCMNLFAGIPAIVLGIWALIDIKQSNGRAKGKGFAICGIVAGLVGGIAIPGVMAISILGQKMPSIYNLEEFIPANGAVFESQGFDEVIAKREDNRQTSVPANDIDEPRTIPCP